ncbi:MAG: hypothetical protein ACR2N1_00795 [Rubripirellula sp.]
MPTTILTRPTTGVMGMQLLLRITGVVFNASGDTDECDFYRL